MAGDWIKIEIDLPDKPKIIAMATRLKLDVDTVVGKLIRLWGWADRQTRDGNAPGVTSAFLDSRIGVTGFAAALESVGWLEVSKHGVKFLKFDEHNGKTAKTRALTGKRVMDFRNAPSVTVALPEKRREEKKEHPPTPPQGGRRRKPEISLPDDFTLNADLERWAQMHTPGVQLETEMQKFRDHAKSHDRRCADWTSAWRNWMRKAIEYSTGGTSGQRRRDQREVGEARPIPGKYSGVGRNHGGNQKAG